MLDLRQHQIQQWQQPADVVVASAYFGPPRYWLIEKDLTYKERLVRLNFSSLELRRLYLDLILCYKIVFGLVGVNFDDFFHV